MDLLEVVVLTLHEFEKCVNDYIPVNDYIQSGQVAKIVYNNEDLYPEKEFEDCKECEDDFYLCSNNNFGTSTIRVFLLFNNTCI